MINANLCVPDILTVHKYILKQIKTEIKNSTPPKKQKRSAIFNSLNIKLHRKLKTYVLQLT